jgi:serine/threonine protein kinase
MAATMHGVILGTAAYMSPEQARGKAVDKRTDIWAFGCVLYELLTGKQAFQGETVTDIIAKILTGDPDWQTLPPTIPVQISTLLKRCLQKDKTLRLRDAGDARIEIHEALTAPPSLSPSIAAPARGTSALGQRTLIFTVLGTLLIGGARHGSRRLESEAHASTPAAACHPHGNKSTGGTTIGVSNGSNGGSLT